MQDEQKRESGKYVEEFSKVIYGVKVQIKETTVIGRDFEIMNFTREYEPAIPYIATEGEQVNTYTTKVKGNDTFVVTIL